MAELVPAILTNDLSDFRKQYAELFALSQYFSRLHIDFIDGEYLPNKTLEIRSLVFFQSHFILAAHFMTLDPKRYFEDAKQIGFSWVLFHFEAFESNEDILETISEAERLNLKTGLVINPETELHKAAKIINKVNMIQLMAIHPGAQGRTFDNSVIEKIIELKKLKKDAIISVDGGMKVGIASLCARAGADIIVAGSAIARAVNKKQAMEDLLKDIKT